MPHFSTRPVDRTAQRCRHGLLALLVLCAGCGTNLQHEPSGRSAALTGEWHLQSPSRETLSTRLRAEMERAQAVQEADFHRQNQRARDRGDRDHVEIEPPAGPASASPDKQGRKRNDWMLRELRARNDTLLAVVLPSTVLRITQSANRIEMAPEGGARRRFDMGTSSTLVNSYATFHIESGWQGNVFMVQSRDAEEGINIIERYQRVGDTLQLQVQLKLRDAHNQQFTARYAQH